MRDERDWREQLTSAGTALSPVTNRPSTVSRDRTCGRQTRALRGPRLPTTSTWPCDLGQRILLALASVLRLDPAPFQQVGLDGYVVAKLIGYHPQASVHGQRAPWRCALCRD